MRELERAQGILSSHHGSGMAAGDSVGNEWQTKQPRRKQSAWAYCCLNCHLKHGDRAWNRPTNTECYLCHAPKPAIPYYYRDAIKGEGKGTGKAEGKGGKAESKGKQKGKSKGKGKDKGKPKKGKKGRGDVIPPPGNF